MKVCESCVYWSQTVANYTGSGPLMALCENPRSANRGTMTRDRGTCPQHEAVTNWVGSHDRP